MLRPRTLKVAASYLFAVACLVWLFHDVEWSRLGSEMSHIGWSLVAVAIVFDILSYACQGWRWKLLIGPSGRISALAATRAIYAGLFTNEILPMRAGEIVRAYLVSRLLAVKFGAIVPSMVVERLFDGIWLALSIGVAAMFVELPQELLRAADILGIVLLAGTGIFVFVIFRGRGGGHGRPGLLAALEDGLRRIGRSKALYGSFAVSFLLLAAQVLAFWLIMWSYGMRLSLWAGTVVLLVVHLGTAIPNAPANVGTYQFFTVAGLALFGVDKTTAAGFSLVVFFLLTVPLWVLGSVALSRSGLSLAGVRSVVSRFGSHEPGVETSA